MYNLVSARRINGDSTMARSCCMLWGLEASVPHCCCVGCWAGALAGAIQMPRWALLGQMQQQAQM
jgi:hypothetical protein